MKIFLIKLARAAAISGCLSSCLFPDTAYSQVELMPWANIYGIRIQGQLMKFETGLRLVGKDWKDIKFTGKEMQRPKYDRKGSRQIVTTTLDKIAITEETEDLTANSVRVKVRALANEDFNGEGLYLTLTLPKSYYTVGTIETTVGKKHSLSSGLSAIQNALRSPTKSIKFRSAQQQLQLDFKESSTILVRNEQVNKESLLVYYIPIVAKTLTKGTTVEKEFTFTSSGLIDKRPVSLSINTKNEGRTFDGFGGNFRLQNPTTDPQVIDYSLKNLRLAWSRVEMPFTFWQPVKNSNVLDSARAGKIHQNVQAAMEMAKRLSDKGIPVILSCWSAPAWAVIGTPQGGQGPDGIWGNALNTESMPEIYKSIADYIVFLKEKHGVDVALFSFNESDLGINIRQTGQEHADLIKGLGAYFVSRGLKTKLLLGDNSDATTYEFIYPALNDPSTHQYIGAISFHSWRGWETETLKKWANAATKLQLPLLVGEGSIDAQAWGYPIIFHEPIYALEEINLYVRMLNICQPASILQWQLTADYSPLAGGGIFGDNGPLRPLQRFWNLKQLADTPKDLKAIPASSNRDDVTIAAMGDQTKKTYTVHLVNNGPARTVTLSGIPAGIRSFKIYTTNKTEFIKKGKSISVIAGKIVFELKAGTFTTLSN